MRREVNKRKGEEYQLIWKDQPDFVRMAAKLNALVIPFAAVGGAPLACIDVLRALLVPESCGQRCSCDSVSIQQPPKCLTTTTCLECATLLCWHILPFERVCESC